MLESGYFRHLRHVIDACEAITAKELVPKIVRILSQLSSEERGVLKPKFISMEEV